MPLTKNDLKQIKDVVVEGLDPYFVAIQKDFHSVAENFTIVKGRFDVVDARLDKIEKLILADHKRRIEKLEEGVKELRDLLAIK